MGGEGKGPLNYNGSELPRLEKWLFIPFKGCTDPSLQGWWVGVGSCHEAPPPEGRAGAAEETSAWASAVGQILDISII